MDPTIKVYMGVIALIVGIFLFSFGLVPMPDSIVDSAMIVVGGILIFCYGLLTWEGFEKSFGKEARITILAPALAVLGAVMIYQAATATWIVSPHNVISGVIGAALIVGPLIWFATRR